MPYTFRPWIVTALTCRRHKETARDALRISALKMVMNFVQGAVIVLGMSGLKVRIERCEDRLL